MCFSPKIKVPKVEAQAIVPPPVPLLDDPTGVKFGGEDDAYESKEGEDNGRIELDKDVKKTTSSSTTKTTAKPTGNTTGIAEKRRARSIGRALGGLYK